MWGMARRKAGKIYFYELFHFYGTVSVNKFIVDRVNIIHGHTTGIIEVVSKNKGICGG